MKLSEISLQKLRLFCSTASDPIDISHPCDEMRWFDFICQTVVENNVLDADTLEEILQNELNEYWAKTLSTEYEKACRILRYYREKQ